MKEHSRAIVNSTNQTLLKAAELDEDGDEDEDEKLDQSNIVENMNDVGFGWQSLNHSWTKPLLLFPEWFYVKTPSIISRKNIYLNQG